jgi:hypothetical protein
MFKVDWNMNIYGYKLWHILALVVVLFVVYYVTRPKFYEKFSVSGPDAIVKLKTVVDNKPVYMMHSNIYCSDFDRGCGNLMFYTPESYEASQFNVIMNGEKIHLKDVAGTLGKCSQTVCPGYYCMTNVDENKIEFTVKNIDANKFVLVTPDNKFVGICGISNQACNVMCLKDVESEALIFELEPVIIEPEVITEPKISNTQSVFATIAAAAAQQ